MPTSTKAVEEAKLLVGAIQVRDAKTAKLYVWRLADLSAENTPKAGGDRRKQTTADGNLLTVEEWAEKIGWTAQGNSVKRLGNLIREARAWPEELRIEGRSIEQHRDARAAHTTVEEASAWLESVEAKNIRDRARSKDLTGSGPVYEAMLKIIRARREVAMVPAKLAGSGILGNEANFPQFRRELERLKNVIDYLDRYLADEMVVDVAELDKAIDDILREEIA